MARAYKGKERNTGARKRKQIIRLSVEGNNKTEKNYFSAFNNKHTKIIFTNGNDTDPVKLAKRLKEESGDYQLDEKIGDRAFCVVDGDVSITQERAIKQADVILSKKGEVIVSNPCIEVWFLSHFTPSNKQYNSSREVEKRLREYIPEYEKNMEGIRNLLKDREKNAIENAKKWDQYNHNLDRSAHNWDYQPSSEIYKVLEELHNYKDNHNKRNVGKK